MQSGNIDKLTKQRRDWVFGYFADEGSPFRSDDFELKWARHTKTEHKAQPGVNTRAKTVSILVWGRMRFRVGDREVVLGREGDYIYLPPGVEDYWDTPEDTLVVVLRWPSVPGDQVLMPADQVASAEGVQAGNIDEFMDRTRGWVFGHFMPEKSPFYETAFELKWGRHRKGDRKAGQGSNGKAESVAILAEGRVRYKIGEREVVCEREGDYVYYPPGVEHSWEFLEDGLTITVRWPSIKGDQTVRAD